MKIDFLIVGAQKAGTTSLFAYLQHSPMLFLPDVKEVHYFDLNYHQPLRWYHDFFSGLGQNNGVLYGEASPYYIYHPLVPKRAYEYNPNLKLILLLRDPIERAISHYHHSIKLGLEQEKDMEKAFAKEAERITQDTRKMISGEIEFSPLHQHFSYVDRSIYTPQIQRWLNYFPEEQMMVIQSEAFFAAPEKTLKKIEHFLNVPLFVPPQFEV
jgi:hypothetical protein